MNTPQPTPEDNSSKPLHLFKFVPGEAGVPPSDDSGEGPTVMIRRIAANTVETQLPPEQQETDEFGIPVKEMMGIIGHCFARGLYCSKDIDQALKDEPALRGQLGRKLPGEEAVRRFRRRFAHELEATLGALYKAEPSLAPELPAPDEQGKTQFFQKQAVERVHDAVWADNTKGRIG